MCGVCLYFKSAARARENGIKYVTLSSENTGVLYVWEQVSELQAGEKQIPEGHITLIYAQVEDFLHCLIETDHGG